MKTLLYTSLLFLTILLSGNLKAQTSVDLNYMGVYSSGSCPTPNQASAFFSGASATNYNDVTDFITIQIFWGDGTDTTFLADLIDNGSTDTMTMSLITHNYYLPGTYTPMAIGTGPDANADTIFGNSITLYSTCVTISGYTYNDNNSNCIYDGGDVVIPGSFVKVTNGVGGSFVQAAHSNASGYYSFNVSNGLTGLFISAVNGTDYLTTCPVAGGYTFNSTGSMTFNFGLECSPAIDYYASHGSICGMGAPGSPGQMGIWAGGTGMCGGSLGPVTITLAMDPLITYTGMILGPPPTTIVGSTLTWNLPLGSSIWSYSEYLRLNTITSTAAVIGTNSCFTVSITGPGTDIFAPNDGQTICLSIGGPWDPNNKTVEPMGIGATGNVAPETDFIYTVNFQNTGTAPAINIYVMDTISSNLDMNTFQIIGSSHTMEPLFTNGNIIRFDYPSINLPDSNANELMSHGWVKYRIKAKTGLANGTQIKNTGHIYFDYNSAIITNTTLNTIDISLGLDQEINAAMDNVLFPNPATNMVTVQFENNVSGNLILIDVTGKQVKSINVNNAKEIKISLQEVPAGFYGLMMPGVELKQNRLQVIK